MGKEKAYRVVMAICVVISPFGVTIFITHGYHWHTLPFVTQVTFFTVSH
jgi:hypothetical protein